MEETYGARLARLVGDYPPFTLIGELIVSPECSHPLHALQTKVRRSHDVSRRTYFVTVPVDYIAAATLDWPTRVGAYSDAVEIAIARVAKTRLTDAERETLLAAARQARAEISASPPGDIVSFGRFLMPIDPRASQSLPGEVAPSWVEVKLEDMPSLLAQVKPQEETLFKLYAKVVDGRRRYREAWLDDDLTVVEHWGICGERGESASHGHESAPSARERYQALKKAARAEGYRPIPLSRHAKLTVEFSLSDSDWSADLDRRHELESELDQLVGWLGLGHMDGGSIGSGTMEVMCYVVDFKIAKAAVESYLRSSAFSDYSRIFREP